MAAGRMLGFVHNLGGAMRPLSTRAGLKMGAGAGAASGLLFSAGTFGRSAIIIVAPGWHVLFRL